LDEPDGGQVGLEGVASADSPGLPAPGAARAWLPSAGRTSELVKDRLLRALRGHAFEFITSARHGHDACASRHPQDATPRQRGCRRFRPSGAQASRPRSLHLAPVGARRPGTTVKTVRWWMLSETLVTRPRGLQ